MENFGHFLFQHLVTLSRQIFRSKQSYFWTADRRFSWEKYLFLDILKQTDHRQRMCHSCWSVFFIISFDLFYPILLFVCWICQLNCENRKLKVKCFTGTCHSIKSFGVFSFSLQPSFVIFWRAGKDVEFRHPPSFLLQIPPLGGKQNKALWILNHRSLKLVDLVAASVTEK